MFVLYKKLTLLSNQILDEICCFLDTLRVGDVQRNSCQPFGGDLLQLIFTLLGVAARDHREAQLVQVLRQVVAEPRVTASDVHIFILNV